MAIETTNEPEGPYDSRTPHLSLSLRTPAGAANRFDTITLKIWERHGIRQAGFWTVAIGDSNQDLYYLLEWDLSPNATKNGPPSRQTRSGSKNGRKPRLMVPSLRPSAT